MAMMQGGEHRLGSGLLRTVNVPPAPRPPLLLAAAAAAAAVRGDALRRSGGGGGHRHGRKGDHPPATPESLLGVVATERERLRERERDRRVQCVRKESKRGRRKQRE